jgi:hypothetical protein
LGPLDDPDFGLADASPEAMLTHVITEYGNIRSTDLADNLKRIKQPWNPDTAIEALFKHGKACRAFAAEGNDPITDTGYVAILIDILENSGVFGDDLKDWDKQPDNEQTLANLIPTFTKANARRLTALSKSTKSVIEANVATALLPTGKVITPSYGLDGWHFCHSHGVCRHSSPHCPAPKEGHIKEATLSNPQNGQLSISGSNRRGNGGRGGGRGRGRGNGGRGGTTNDENTPPATVAAT